MNNEFGPIDVDQLRQLTRTSQGRKAAEARAAADYRAQQDQAKRRVEAAQAEVVIAKIPSLLRQAALEGENRAQVMKVEYDDFTRPDGPVRDWRFLDPSWLKGSARIVYDYCAKSRLSPTLDPDDDGVGVESWWNMTAHW